MQFVQEFAGLPVDNLASFMKDSTKNFEKSLLYNSEVDSKFVDESLRSSRFRTFTEASLFDLIDKDIMPLINNAGNSSNSNFQSSPRPFFKLHRSDVTHIVYLKGGFFKKHQDFLSLTSNVIQEYTLIICITPPDDDEGAVEGGETIIYSNNIPHKSTATTTRGSALLFRKDLHHEGAELMEGRKEIITLNLWAFEPQVKDDPILLVTCPQHEELPETAAAIQECADTLRQLAEDRSSFALSASMILRDFPESMLATKLRFEDLAGQQSRDKQIVHHHCHFTWEEFSVVVKVLDGSRLTEDEICLGATAIRFYQLPPSKLLTDVAVDAYSELDDPNGIQSRETARESRDQVKQLAVDRIHSWDFEGEEAEAFRNRHPDMSVGWLCCNWRKEQLELIGRALYSETLAERLGDALEENNYDEARKLLAEYKLATEFWCKLNSLNAITDDDAFFDALYEHLSTKDLPPHSEYGVFANDDENNAIMTQVEQFLEDLGSEVAGLSDHVSDMENRLDELAFSPKAKHPKTETPPRTTSEHGPTIICSSKTRAELVAQRAKDLHANYLIFNAVMMEGEMSGYMDIGMTDSIEVPMTPTACFFGDYNNCLGYRNLIDGSKYKKEDDIYSFPVERRCGEYPVPNRTPEQLYKENNDWGVPKFETLSDSEQDEYKEQALTEKAKFEAVWPEKGPCTHFLKPNQLVTFNGGGLEEIKPATTAQMLFVEEKLAEARGDLPYVENEENVKKEAKDEFKALSETSKSKYNEMEVADRVRFAQEEQERAAFLGTTKNVAVGEACWYSPVRTFNLHCSIEHDDSMDGPKFTAAPSQIIELVFPSCGGDKHNETGKMPAVVRALPTAKADEGVVLEDDGTSYFHFDSEGKSCFSAAEAARASERLREMNFFSRLKEEIQHARFVLPQESGDASGFFCNEQVYGKMTILHVHGVVCLD